MVSNKYHRDFNSYGALKRPGRMDRTLFQNIEDCGDGFGGIQWMMLKAFGKLLLPRFVIEDCEYNGVDTMSNGYIMWNGEPIEVDEQAIVVANGEFLYINQSGIALTTAVQATAQEGVMIYERDALAVGYDIRFRLIDNVLKVFGLDAQQLRIHHDVTIDGDLDVDGTSNLDDVDIAGTTNMNDVLNMNDNQINDVADPTNLQDAVTLAYLRAFMPVGAIIMFDGVGWVDNISMVGWYQCNAANVAHGVPDLEDQFIRASAASGAGGGADTVTLIANQIPTHISDGVSANHTHTGTTSSTTHVHTVGTQSATHMHAYRRSMTSTVALADWAFGTKRYAWKNTDSAQWTDAEPTTHIHSVTGGGHTHTLTSGNNSADHTHQYTNAAQPVNNMPTYYKLIFVMRTV